MWNKRSLFVLILSFLVSSLAWADEGMWLPLHIKRLNQVDLQQKGLQLSAEEIYSVNQSSLKDAIVSLGGFCTGEFISSQGLLLTNHHCGYSQIQSHSSPEQDYLRQGFWAMNRNQELPNPGLFVDILVRMEDVTAQVLEGIDQATPEQERGAKIADRTKALAAEANTTGRYVTYVRDFFNGNEYYLFVYERYGDVRLVGAPPEAIGKFGGDTDNWMWPRHTGDFAMFRVYAGPDNLPAEFADQNVPFKPRHHLPISMSKIEQGDFSMVFGFPGRTSRFMTSHGLRMTVEQSNPARIKLRERRLALMKEDMDADEATRIKYAAKYAQVSNYYKYFIGQNEGIHRMKTIPAKLTHEQRFQEWASAEAVREQGFRTSLQNIDEAYAGLREYNLSNVYMNEAVLASEILLFGYRFLPLYNLLKSPEASEAAVQAAVTQLRETAQEHFKNYNAATDRKIMAALLEMYYQDVPREQHPDIFKTVANQYNGDFTRFTNQVFNQSLFASEAKVAAFLENPSREVIENDLAFKTIQSAYSNYVGNIGPKINEYTARLGQANRTYVSGLRLMNPNTQFYPDANSTLRISFGGVKNYVPRDGVLYQHYTTMRGIEQKEDPNELEFVVPDKLMELYRNKDFGRYATNGEMRVNFITDNDITGGNSGSPVINGRGELIGLAFDGNWEAMTGDLAYDPEYKRCINVNIKYVLFIIDKFAGAGHLVEEMTLVDNGNPRAGEALQSPQPEQRRQRRQERRQRARQGAES
jgi:hypothetical protein